MPRDTNWQRYDQIELLHISSLELLGSVVAVFTGRTGGASPRWDGGLNWSYSVGDVPASVEENKRRTLAALGLTIDRTVLAGLVHGTRVVAVTGDEETGADGMRYVHDCDALITDRPGLALVVTAADCVPILLYDPVRRAVGAVHAGWRGTVAGITGKAVQAMAEQFGSNPADVAAAIGPSIGPCCYEVDEPVAGPLRTYYGADAEQVLRPGKTAGKYMLDLWAANQLDLNRAGVHSVQISEECTSCGVNRLFSHRAEVGKAGRGAAIIALKE